VEQHELRPAPGATKRRKRVGRGNASGHGTYATKGIKGQQARAGSGPGARFEGGQTPLVRRLPRRRGFRNPFRVAYEPVNVGRLEALPAGSDVTPESLRDLGVVHSLRVPIKVLGDGELTTKLAVRVHRVSAAARAKIEAAGGTVEELTPRPQPAEGGGKKARRKIAAAAGTVEELTPQAQPDEDAGGKKARKKIAAATGAVEELTPQAPPDEDAGGKKARKKTAKTAATAEAPGAEPEASPASERTDDSDSETSESEATE